MTKTFSVNIGGQSMQIDGPDDGTQEQAQEQATRHWQQKQAADVNKDFSGPGRILANVAQGGAELFGGPAQLAGATPGPSYQQAEREPTTAGDKVARFAGAALPLAPLGLTGLAKSAVKPVAGAAAIPASVGAVEGASAPADTRTQRAVNTGVGAFTGGFGRGAGGSSALDRLAGAAAGMMMGHGLGGGESMFATYLGGKIGANVGHEAHEAVAAFLRKFPPSVVSRAIASLSGSVTKGLADQYDYSERDRGQSPNR